MTTINVNVVSGCSYKNENLQYKSFIAQNFQITMYSTHLARLKYLLEMVLFL